MTNYKHILYAALCAIIPFGYSALVGAFPAFPLSQENFVALLLWLIGLPIGGWQLVKALRYNGRLTVVEGSRTRALTVAGFDWKSMLKAVLALILPIIYKTISGLDLPFTSDQFVALVLWIVGLLIGGWQIGKYVNKSKGLLVERAGE